MYFQIMSLVIARSSCSQRRWKKLHPWTTLVGNCLLKPTGECLACGSIDVNMDVLIEECVFVCENQLWIWILGSGDMIMSLIMVPLPEGNVFLVVSLNVLFSWDSKGWTQELPARAGPFPMLVLVCCASACPFQPQFSCKRDVAFREARPCLRTFSFPAFQLVHFLPVFFVCYFICWWDIIRFIYKE